MIDLFPDGFEEVSRQDGVELAAYTDAAGEERLLGAFSGGASVDVASDWRERWRTFHRPVQVGSLWIGPSWEVAPPGVTAIVVDPGRAFGTGAHATTRLCLELLQEVPVGSLVDVGCGSGVLAVAAARLGFAPVIALDDDPAAVEVTKQNAATNGVSVDARAADVTQDDLPATDVAVANISADVVRDLSGRLAARHAVTAGYLLSFDPALQGFRRVDRRSEEGWAADRWERAE